MFCLRSISFRDLFILVRACVCVCGCVRGSRLFSSELYRREAVLTIVFAVLSARSTADIPIALNEPSVRLFLSDLAVLCAQPQRSSFISIPYAVTPLLQAAAVHSH